MNDKTQSEHNRSAFGRIALSRGREITGVDSAADSEGAYLALCY